MNYAQCVLNTSITLYAKAYGQERKQWCPVAAGKQDVSTGNCSRVTDRAKRISDEEILCIWSKEFRDKWLFKKFFYNVKSFLHVHLCLDKTVRKRKVSFQIKLLKFAARKQNSSQVQLSINWYTPRICLTFREILAGNMRKRSSETE